jgi:hypothetical protein
VELRGENVKWQGDSEFYSEPGAKIEFIKMIEVLM